MLDKTSKSRHTFGSQINTAKLTPDQVIEARRRHAAGEKGATLARAYGITKQSMYALLKGKNWKQLPEPVLVALSITTTF